MARDRIAAYLQSYGQETPDPATSEDISSKELSFSLLQECKSLLSDLTSLQAHLAKTSRPNIIELRQFKSSLNSELKTLERLYEQASRISSEDEEGRNGSQDTKDVEEEGDGSGYGEKSEEETRLIHSLRSCNLPFFVSVWRVAKTSCKSLQAFSKRFYWVETKRWKSRGLEGDIQQMNISAGPLNSSNKELQEDGRKKHVLVDIVADNGAEWVKVSTVTPSRLLFELAKMGWEDWDADSGDEDEVRLQNDDDDGSDDENDSIELIRLASDMKKAAALVRVRYRHPRIRFVLPKITEGQMPEIDRILKQVRKAGVIVECGPLPAESPTEKDPSSTQQPNNLGNIPLSLLPSPHQHMTDTLNVDCTLLLALVSDLSHLREINQSPKQHRAIRRQIEAEAKQPLVPTDIWPAIGDRRLLCTSEAHKRMREIVDTIGTQYEKERTKLLLNDFEPALHREALLSRFQALSDHKVPADWQLPVKVVEAQGEIERGLKEGKLPGVAYKVGEQLSDINRSVFLYGWVSGLTTISSNRTVARQIETIVEDNRDGDDELVGPSVWLCDTARSLIGKEGRNKDPAPVVD